MRIPRNLFSRLQPYLQDHNTLFFLVAVFVLVSQRDSLCRAKTETEPWKSGGFFWGSCWSSFGGSFALLECAYRARGILLEHFLGFLLGLVLGLFWGRGKWERGDRGRWQISSIMLKNLQSLRVSESRSLGVSSFQNSWTRHGRFAALSMSSAASRLDSADGSTSP